MEIPSEGVPMNLNLKSLALVNLGTNFSLRYVSNGLRINSKIQVKNSKGMVSMSQTSHCQKSVRIGLTDLPKTVIIAVIIRAKLKQCYRCQMIEDKMRNAPDQISLTLTSTKLRNRFILLFFNLILLQLRSFKQYLGRL